MERAFLSSAAWWDAGAIVYICSCTSSLINPEESAPSEPLSRFKTGGSSSITAAFSGLSPHVAAQLQHPGPQHGLADLSQATHSDSDQPGADQRRTAHAVHLRVGFRWRAERPPARGVPHVARLLG